MESSDVEFSRFQRSEMRMLSVILVVFLLFWEANGLEVSSAPAQTLSTITDHKQFD